MEFIAYIWVILNWDIEDKVDKVGQVGKVPLKLPLRMEVKKIMVLLELPLRMEEEIMNSLPIPVL